MAKRSTAYLASFLQMKLDLNADQASKSVKALIEALDESLKASGEATLPGIGRFEIVEHRINTAGLRNQPREPGKAITRSRLRFIPQRQFVAKINGAATQKQPTQVEVSRRQLSIETD